MADAKNEEQNENTASTENAEGAEAGEGKKSKKKIIIIAVLGLLLLVGGGAGLYFGGVIGGHGAEGEEAAHGESEGEAGGEHGEKGPKQIVYYDLPEFLVNLSSTGTGRQTSFLKMTVSLELSSEEDKKTVETNLPRVLDSFNTYLRELRATDLYGSAGIYRLREELLVRINKDVAPVKVNDIFFKQILVQ